jgi:hypothetical protein
VGAKHKQWAHGGNTQVMAMDDDGGHEDAFLAAMAQFEAGSAYYEPLRVDRSMLQNVPSNEASSAMPQGNCGVRVFGILPRPCTGLFLGGSG